MLKNPPLFIIGPLRSGTTLARQIITWAIPCSYLSNCTQLAIQRTNQVLPLEILCCRQVRIVKRVQTAPIFTSEHGYSQGLGNDRPGLQRSGPILW